MKNRWSCFFITISMLTGLAWPVAADDVTFTDLLTGKVAPLSITMKDLTPGWMQMTVAGQQNSQTDFFTSLISSRVKSATSPSLTLSRGQVVTVQGLSYLIVYRIPANYQALAGQHLEDPFSGRGLNLPLVEVTPETKLAMTLLNMKQIGSMKDLSPVDPAALYTTPDKTTKPKPPATLMESARNRARQTQATSYLRQLAMSVMMYAQEHNETLPSIIGQRDIETMLHLSAQVLTSPVTGQPFRFNYAMSGKGLGQIPNPTVAVLFYDEVDDAGMRSVAFVDGHVEQVNAERWKQMLNAGGIE